MKMVLGKPEDALELNDFYQEVCRHQIFDAYGADWHWGIYPSEQDILNHLLKEELVYGRQKKKMVAAAVWTVGDDSMYTGVKWRYCLPSSKIAYIHLVAVHPDFRRQHLASVFLEFLFSYLKGRGIELLRLDVVKDNLAAKNLYLHQGFEYCQDQEVFYEDTGYLVVELYEKSL